MRGFTWILHFPPLNRTELVEGSSVGISWVTPTHAPCVTLCALGASWPLAWEQRDQWGVPAPHCQKPPIPSWGHPASFCGSVLKWWGCSSSHSVCSVWWSKEAQRGRGAMKITENKTFHKIPLTSALHTSFCPSRGLTAFYRSFIAKECQLFNDHPTIKYIEFYNWYLNTNKRILQTFPAWKAF